MDLLKTLIDIKGPSGNEGAVRNFIKKAIKPYVDTVHVDKYGNLVAHKKGVGPKVLLTAHMDEIGLMIKSIDTKGLIYCSEIGGVEPITLLGEKVLVETKGKPIYGIITTKEISNAEIIEKVPKMEDIIIDTGLSKKELEKSGVKIGSYLYLLLESSTLGCEDIIAGKALDDRIGCFILLEVAKKIQKCKTEIYFVFTVQEEIGLYGGKTSIYSIDPDWAITVDVTNAEDFYENPRNCIGKGPCLTIKDADTITSRCINGWIEDIAKKKKIPLQLEVNEIGTTDAFNIAVAKGGIPTAVIGVAVRNIHTTSSIASIPDIKKVISILETLLQRPVKKLCIPE